MRALSHTGWISACGCSAFEGEGDGDGDSDTGGAAAPVIAGAPHVPRAAASWRVRQIV
jgi:hypothetical protein